MDPNCEACEDDIGHQSAQDSEDHDVGDVLEEPLAAHVVSAGEDDGRNAEVEEDVVVEDNILLDHVVRAAVGGQTDQEADEGDVARLVAERHIPRRLLLANDDEGDYESEDKKCACLHNGGCSVSHGGSISFRN